MLLASLGRFLVGMGGTLLFLLAFQSISVALADSGEGGSSQPHPFCSNASVCDDGCNSTGILSGVKDTLCGTPIDPLTGLPDWGGSSPAFGCWDNGINGCNPGCACIERGTVPANECQCDT